MHPCSRKILASVGGLLVVAFAVAWAFYSFAHASEIVGQKVGLPSIFDRGDAIYKKYGDVYTTLSVFGLAVSSGFAFTLLTWERRPKRWRIELTFLIMLLLVLPMSLVNFWSGDVFVSRSQQIYLNLIQCFLVGVCLLQLSRIAAETDTEIVLKVMSTLFLLAFGLFIPLLFTALWSLVAVGIISVKDSELISSGWISSISGIVALVISFLQYRLAKSKHKVESTKSPNGIILR